MYNNRYKGKPSGKLVEHIRCTNCPSSDAMAVHEQSGTSPVKHNAWCWSCSTYEPNPPGFLGMSKDRRHEPKNLGQGQEDSMQSHSSLRNSAPPSYIGAGTILNSSKGNITPDDTSVTTSTQPTLTKSTPTNQDILSEFNTYPIRAIPDRGLSLRTCERYGVRVSLSPRDGTTILSHMYPYHKKGILTGYNQRVVETKNFFAKGDRKGVGLFGSHLPKAGKTLYITEGELDAMSLYQVLWESSTLDDFNPSVVSLAHGAASAVRDITEDFEFVDSFEKIVLVFDQDEPGQAAIKDVCTLLAGKVFIAKLSEKDPNDMLLAGKANEMKWEVLKHAKPYMPDNILNYADAYNRFKDSRNQESFPFPETYTGLNEKTYGVRKGDLVVVTSGTGMGKTQVLREFKYHYFNTTDWLMADIALEEDIGESMSGMMALHLNKRISLPDVHVTDEETDSAFDHLYSTRRWDGYDFFGGLDDDTLFSKIRWMAATGKSVIWLDHLSIIISEFADQGDERQRIDMIMTKLARMCKELDIIIFLVVHLKKTSTGTSFEEGATPSLDDLRGSGTLKQLPMTILALSRNQQHDDSYCANTSKLTVLKCRFTGRTGTADYLHFDATTGRMNVVPEPANYTKKKPSSFGGDY